MDNVPNIGNQDLCVSCGHCISICPTDAIIHESFYKENFHFIKKNILPDSESLEELFKSRRSIRSFEKRSVEKNFIKKAIQAAQFAPSTNNIQSTKYVVLEDSKIINKIIEYTKIYLDRTIKLFKNPILGRLFLLFSKNKIDNINNMIRDYKEILKNLENGNDLILHDAPAILFFYANKNIGYSDVNAYLALQNASLSLFGMGLGSFYAGYIVAAAKKNNKILDIINIPRDHEIYGCLAIGYPKLHYKKWIDREKPNIKWL